MSAIDRAITAVGGVSALAERVKVTPQAVINWRKRGVPAKRALAVEAATNGCVTRHELCPEMYPEAS